MPYVHRLARLWTGVGEMEEWERRVAPGQSLEDFECRPVKEKRAVPEKLEGRRRTGRGLPPLNP